LVPIRGNLARKGVLLNGMFYIVFGVGTPRGGRPFVFVSENLLEFGITLLNGRRGDFANSVVSLLSF